MARIARAIDGGGILPARCAALLQPALLGPLRVATEDEAERKGVWIRRILRRRSPAAGVDHVHINVFRVETVWRVKAIAAVRVREHEFRQDRRAHAAPHSGECVIGEGAEVVAQMIQLDHARAEIAEPNHEEHVAAIDADGGAEAPIDHRVSALLLVPMRREQRAVEGPLWGELLFAPDIQAGLVDKGVDLIANGTGTFIEIIVHHVLTEGNHLPDLVVERRHGPLRRHHLAARADDGINLSTFADAQFPAPLVRGLVREIDVENRAFVHALHPV